jgi:hypothetical protein
MRMGASEVSEELMSLSVSASKNLTWPPVKPTTIRVPVGSNATAMPHDGMRGAKVSQHVEG